MDADLVPARGPDQADHDHPHHDGQSLFVGSVEQECAEGHTDEGGQGDDAGAPHVRALSKRVKAKVQDCGYIVTLGGRRCRFPKGRRGYEWTHKSLNRLIQGSGADQTKAAMVELDKQGYFLQLQIHDSIEATVSSEKETEQISNIMRDIIELRVPVRVDYKSGCSWGAVK